MTGYDIQDFYIISNAAISTAVGVYELWKNQGPRVMCLVDH